MNKNPFARWRGNFLTGLAVLLPTVVTLAIIKWLFGTIASFTDWLLFFLPTSWTHDPVSARMYWYWSLAAFLLAVCQKEFGSKEDADAARAKAIELQHESEKKGTPGTAKWIFEKTLEPVKSDLRAKPD